MVGTCTAADGTGSLVLSDDVAADRISRMNSEAYRAVLSAQIQPNDAKTDRIVLHKTYCKSKPRASQGKEMESSSIANSPDFNPIKNVFHLMKTQVRPERP